MAPSPHLARSGVLVLAVLAAAGCGPPAEPTPEPQNPPPAVAAGRAGTLSGDEVQGQHVSQTEELFSGRFPGVEVLRLPSGGISVRIRGATSVNGSTEPLYVVDGITVQPDPGGALRWLNPRDVERIEVLKDIGSTAFYGVRGANGVILITTRH